MKHDFYCLWTDDNCSPITLESWKAYAKEHSFPFSVAYFAEFEDLKKASVENPLIPVLVHTPDGESRKVCAGLLALRRRGTRIFCINTLNAYKDGMFAFVKCDTPEQLDACLRYLVREKLNTRFVKPDLFKLSFGYGFSGHPKDAFVPI